MTQYEALCEVFGMACLRFTEGPSPSEKELQANRIVSQMLAHCKMPDGSSSQTPKDSSENG